MTTPDPSTFRMLWQVDDVYGEAKRALCDLTIHELQVLLTTHYQFNVCLRCQHHSNADDCFWLMSPGGQSTAKLERLCKYRTFLAMRAGITPAPFHSFVPEFDPNFLRGYRYCYRAVCKYGSRSCIRPSHIVIEAMPSGRRTNYPLIFGRGT